MSEPNYSDPDVGRPDFLVTLGLMPPVTVEDVKQAYLEKAKTAHPDHGGDPQQFMRIHSAFEQATQYARFKAGRLEWLTQWVGQYAEQQDFIKEIQAFGGEVEVGSTNPLTQSIGPDFATVLDQIAGIRFTGSAIDDRVLLHLGGQQRMLAGLKSLSLIRTKVTSVGLRQVYECRHLQHLDLSGTRVSPRGVLGLLAHLGELESIVLTDTGIGWWSRIKLRFSHRGLAMTA